MVLQPIIELAKIEINEQGAQPEPAPIKEMPKKPKKTKRIKKKNSEEENNLQATSVNETPYLVQPPSP